MTAYLAGGGWNGQAADEVYGPFLRAAGAVSAAKAHGAPPTVVCLLVDEGDGEEQFARYAPVLKAVAPCTPVPCLVPVGAAFTPSVLAEADALFIGGGLTPAYQEALSPVLAELRGLLTTRGMPYAGFSAGAVVAARDALVGGWLGGGLPVCPDDAAEDLEEIEVRPGLGLVPCAVEVHAAQWGTLARLIAAVARENGPRSGVAIDENTLLTVNGDRAEVSGLGRVHLVVRTDTATGTYEIRGTGREETSDGTGHPVVVRAYRAGQRFRL